MSDVYVDDPDRLDRVVTEVLGGVDVWEEAPGPDGPWHYRSLTVRRKQNKIYVDDVDGKTADVLPIPAEDRQVDDLHEALANKLDELNEETLDEL